MNRDTRSPLGHAALATLVAFGAAGCRSGGPHIDDAYLVDRIPGLAEVEVQEWRVLVMRDDESGLAMLVNDLPARSADLRVGERFAISDGSIFVDYQLLAIEEGTARFRLRVLSALRNDPGLRSQQSVVAVRTYPQRPRP
ncbi:MAG: hypothetical protein LC135_16510 [Phycisphaerae bacterium]|nr:hypothetical protein [Phycisphaerae bacterium]MCZ2401442.1 hypothetical protein [Phycisphaerae bacterium]